MEDIEFTHETPGNRLVIRLIELRETLAIISLIIGAIVLTSYLSGMENIYRPVTNAPATHPYTAIFLISAAIGLYRIKIFTSGKGAKILVVLPGFLSAILLVNLSLGTNILPDNLLFNNILEQSTDLSTPIYTSANTCFAFILITLSFWLRKYPLQSQVIGLLAILISVISIIGYIYGFKNLYGRMSILTVAGLIPLSFNVFFLTAHRPVLRTILTTLHHAVIARWVLLIFVVFTALIGYLTPIMFGSFVPQYYGIFIGALLFLGSMLIAVIVSFFEKIDHKRRIVERNIQKIATHDHLTGLYNRRWLETITNHDLELSKREGKPTGLLMLDIDNFKAINDKFGHRFGDHILKTIAESLIENTRRSDIACRIGGEEFSILLPNTDLEAATMIAEKIRLSIISKTEPIMEEKQHEPITVSIGVSVSGENIQSYEILYQQADDRLYKAKHAGKNQVFSG